MDLKALSNAYIVYAPRFSIDEIKEALKQLQLNFVVIDIMDFEHQQIKGHDCVVVCDNLVEKEDTEEEDIRFFNQCNKLINSLHLARHEQVKYILLGDFGAGAKNIANLLL